MEEITLKVTGMTCASCVRHVDRALRDVDGVADVKVRYREGLVLVRREASATDAELVAAVREAGYEAARAA
jgi:copper chaperone